MSRPIVTFLSDFGSSDPFVGVCQGVIVRTCPEAEVIHLAHGIEPQSVGQGSRVLAASVPYLPVGVHMAVVDPGVGSERRAICLRSADGRLFVGPDNGLLIAAAEASGGIELAVEITSSEYMLDSVSRTFHGRDVFAPVSGHLAAGLDPERLGHAVDPDTLVRARELATQRGGVAADGHGSAARPVREHPAVGGAGRPRRAVPERPQGRGDARRRQLLRDLRAHVRRRLHGAISSSTRTRSSGCRSPSTAATPAS